MAQIMRIHEYGGPEVMHLEEAAVGSPGPGEVRLRHTAIGLNLSDVYRRTGAHLMPLPLVLGSEGAGVVEEVGDGVSDLKPGDRVVYASVPGSYCSEKLIAADRMVKLPDAIDDRTAAAMMLKGLTVDYLIHRSYAVKAGDTVLIHAAAGGVGLIFCQWARHLGATVIGTVGNDEKAALARDHGCDHALPYSGFAAAVMDITGGQGCHAVYDSVGRDTIEDSFRCLRPHGVLASFGQASGEYTAFDLSLVRGSRFFTRASLPDFIRTRDELMAGAGRLFDVVGKGIVRIEVNQTYPLADAAQAHRDLEARRTTGSTVILP